MSVARENLKEFFFISPHWDEKSQRLLGTVGFEFEIAEKAFERLYKLSVLLTDSAGPKWTISEGDAAELAILARAFVDHAVRIQKLFKSMAKKDGELWQNCEDFFQQNSDLFSLRDALHHVESRIHSGVGLDEKQPAHGDFSWKCVVPPDKLDCFWVAFGPTVIGEFAGPVMSTSCSLRQPIDQLIYRAHGISVDLFLTLINIDKFVTNAHTIFANSLKNQLAEQGIVRDELSEEKAGIGLHGRLRIAGLSIT